MLKYTQKNLFYLVLFLIISVFIGALQVQAQIKDNEFLSGQLREIIIEAQEDSKHTETEPISSVYVIDTKDFGLVAVNFKEASKYRNGYVEVKGYWNPDNSFYVENLVSSNEENIKSIVRGEVETLDKDGKPIKSETFGPQLTTGGHSVLFILANFTNVPTEPVSVTQIRDTLYNNANSANNFYLNASKQRFWLKGLQRPDIDVVNWITLPHTNADCESNLYSTWTNEAEAIARSQGFEPNNYRSVVLIFPQATGCSMGGAFATIGTLGSTNSQNKIWFVWGPGLSVDTNFNSTFAHELGHNLGLLHSSAIQNCTIGNAVFPDGCQNFEYGDSFSPMGSTPPLSRNFNNFHLYQLGWLGGQAKVAMLPQAGTYNFNLMPPSTVTKGYQVVTFPLKDANGNLNGQSAYLEFRKQILPFEDFTGGQFSQNVHRGISLRFAPTNLSNQERSFLLDYHNATWWFADAAIEVGETYQNTTYGFSLTTNSTSPQRGARFNLQLNH